MLLASPERASVNRNATSLVDALRAKGEDARLVVVPQPEWRIGKKRFGGLVATWVQRTVNDHALDPVVAGRNSKVVTVHDIAEEIFPERYQHTLMQRLNVRMSRWVGKRVPVIVTPSAVTKRDLVERWRVAPERIFVAPWGIGHHDFHPRPEIAREPGLVVTWTDDQPRKNLVLVMRAMRILRAEGMKLRFERAGGVWADADWRPVAKEADLDFTELGFVERAELPRLAARGSVFVWPSFYEGFGFPPLEAMACGTPVVALDNEINREVLGDAALYCANDPADAARALREALTDPPPASKVIAHAAKYTWERCADAHIRAYRAAGL